MAYKYFTEKLLSSDLNLADVFPVQQDDAKVQVNASYNLFEIAQFIQDRTDNFKNTEQQYIDLDSAISEIISKWYKSQGQKNPFVQVSLEDEEFKATNPRESAIVESGKLKSKGTASAPSKTKEVKEEVKEKQKSKEKIVEEEKLSEKGIKFKNDLLFQKEVLYDDVDDAQKDSYKSLLQVKLDANELMADEGDEDFVERVKILKDFIKSLK
jgi:hypothetical protein